MICISRARGSHLACCSDVHCPIMVGTNIPRCNMKGDTSLKKASAVRRSTGVLEWQSIWYLIKRTKFCYRQGLRPHNNNVFFFIQEVPYINALLYNPKRHLPVYYIYSILHLWRQVIENIAGSGSVLSERSIPCCIVHSLISSEL